MIEPDEIARLSQHGLDAWHRNQLDRDTMKRPAPSQATPRSPTLEGNAPPAASSLPKQPITPCMDFHHRIPGSKRFNLNSSGILSRRWETVVEEAASERHTQTHFSHPKGPHGLS